MGICLMCGLEFPTAKYGNGSRKKYCSKICSAKANPQNPLRGIVPGKHMGGYSELCVCADLLRRGYEVYRSVTQHCSGDLMIEKEGKRYKVEVRTSYRGLNGKIQYPKANIRSDIVALNMTDESRVIYLNHASEEEINL